MALLGEGIWTKKCDFPITKSTTYKLGIKHKSSYLLANCYGNQFTEDWYLGGHLSLLSIHKGQTIEVKNYPVPINSKKLCVFPKVLTDEYYSYFNPVNYIVKYKIGFRLYEWTGEELPPDTDLGDSDIINVLDIIGIV